MNRHGSIAATAVIAMFAGLLLLLWLPSVVMNAANGIGGSWPAVAGVVLLLAELAYYALLFFAAPQCLLLRFLGIRSRWAYLLTGVCSGLFFLFVYFIGSGWFTAISHTGGAVQAIRLFLHAAGLWGLIWASAFGMLFGWLWSLPIFRLPGDNTRDWQLRIHTNNPADLL